MLIVINILNKIVNLFKFLDEKLIQIQKKRTKNNVIIIIILIFNRNSTLMQSEYFVHL